MLIVRPAKYELGNFVLENQINLPADTADNR